MDTKLATRQIRLNEWAGIIKDRMESGMNVNAYCEQQGLSRDAYYYWLRKVKEVGRFRRTAGCSDGFGGKGSVLHSPVGHKNP